jgi:hypothetical protein
MPDADIVKPILAEALREFFHNEDGQDYDTDDFEPVAASVLRALHRAGWRLERTDEADLIAHLYDGEANA